LLRIGPSSSLASCSQRYQQRFPREAASIKQQYGPDSIGVIVSSKATNEDGFNTEVRTHRQLLQRLLAIIGVGVEKVSTNQLILMKSVWQFGVFHSIV
jgi:hypothetical protein